MKPSIRLVCLACLIAAVVIASGCGHNKPTVTPVSKRTAPANPAKKQAKAQTPAKSAEKTAAEAPATKLSGESPFGLGGLDSPLANPVPNTLTAAPQPSAVKPAPAAMPKSGKPTAPQLLAVVQSVYRGYSTLKAEGSSVTVTKADGKPLGKTQTTTIKLLFARPNKMSIDTRDGLLVTDGKTIYNYVPSAKRYIKGPLTKEIMQKLIMSRPGVGVLGLLFGVPYAQYISSPSIRGEATVSGHGVYVMALKLKNVPNSGVEGTETLWIGKSDLGLYKSEVVLKFKPKAPKGSQGKVPKLVEQRVTTTMSRFEPNAKIPTSTFAFKPPMGAKLYEQPKLVDMSGKPAPDFSFQAADGTTKKLSDLKGRVVLLDFWALPMAEEQLPAIQSLSTKYKDVQLVAVNLNSKKDKVAEYLKSKNLTFPVVFADEPIAKLANEGYKVIALPTLFIIDDQGVIREEFVGIVKQKDIEAKLDKVIAK